MNESKSELQKNELEKVVTPDTNYSTEDKNLWGDKFKEILKKEAQEYSGDIAEIIAGKEFAQAIRDETVLLRAIQVCIKEPGFPTEGNYIRTIINFALPDSNPLDDRMKYHSAINNKEKNFYAEEHNRKMEIYSQNIKNIIQSLGVVLPDEMVHELWARNKIFLKPLRWADENK